MRRGPTTLLGRMISLEGMDSNRKEARRQGHMQLPELIASASAKQKARDKSVFA